MNKKSAIPPFLVQNRCPARSLVLTAGILLTACCQMATGAVIDLSKPVSESLTPDGIYWNFDGGTLGGSTPDPVKDESGNGYDGILGKGRDDRPMPTYGSGKYGTAIYLNGNSGTLADPSIRWNGTGTDDNTKLVYTGAGFTGGAWINFSSVSTGTQDVIIFERGMSVFDPTVGNFYSLQLFRGSVGTWRLRLRVGNNTSVPVSFLSAETTNVFESLGAWNHVGFTFDIGSTESVLQFWLNGEKFGDPISTTFKFETTTTGLQRSFSVGERTLAGNSNFNGFIDDVFVTGGVHAFAIPEPGVAALLLPLLGWMGVRMRRRGLKHP